MPPKLKLGKEVFFGSNVMLDSIADGALISIGDYSTITSGVSILIHDISCNHRIGATYVAPVNIGKRVFIGIRSTILPGVTIGDDAIIGAGSVVVDDVEEGTIVAGIPAKKISLTKTVDEKRIELSKSGDVFDYLTYDKPHHIEQNRIEEMIDSVKKNGYFFIK